MVRLETFLESEWCRTWVLALLHTLWQACIAAGLLCFYLRRCPAGATGKRYAASVTALVAIVLCSLVTWSILNHTPAGTGPRARPGQPQGVAPTTPTPTYQSAPFVVTPQGVSQNALTGTLRTRTHWQVWGMVAWLVGVAVMLTRAGLTLMGESRLRRRCARLLDEPVLSLVEQLRRQMRIGRRVAVCVSEHISVPGVVGCIWPALLLPASAISGVPIEDLRAVLIHELAHIKRYDYLVNFCQMVVEALLFFNPAVWWISRQIRIEREACCDAAGVALAGPGVKYAEALVAWAQRLRRSPAAATISFAGPPDSNPLLDRIKRLTLAGHRPPLRLPWPTALAMTALSMLCLTGLWKGTDLAVTAAARILTPQERIDKITEVSEKYGSRQYGRDDQIRISGVARTWDGKSPTGAVRSAVATVVQNGTSFFGPRGARIIGDEVRFDESVPYGRIFLMLSVDGYAPAFAGPFETEPGGHIDGIELTLGAGFTARVHVTDENGAPVKGAVLTGGYPYREIQSFIYTINLTTDANGIAMLEHAAAEKVTLFIHADGFESRMVEGLVPDANATRVVALKKGRPAGGIVTAKTTGLPIAGAELRVLESSAGNSQLSVGNVSGPPDATTDNEGRFELKRLLAGWKYLIFVRAPGYGYEYAPDVSTADHDMRIALGEKQAIKGRIIGDLSLLSTGNSSPSISVVDRYQFPGFSGWRGYPSTKAVTVRDGIGYFEIDDFWGQMVVLQAAGREVLLKIGEDSLEDIVIDLQTPALRQVQLKFQVPPGGPPIQGQVRIHSYTERSPNRWDGTGSQLLDIQDGQATCEVPVPSGLTYSIDFGQSRRPVGYWFNEPNAVLRVPVGGEPYVITVPVYPAGAIYGTIFRLDGSRAEDARVDLVVAQKPDGPFQQNLTLSRMFNGLSNAVDRGAFNATPLPLNGQYAIVAHDGYAFAMSDAFSLDEKNPVIQADIHLPQGVDLEGRLLDADEFPARSTLSLEVRVKKGELSWGMGGAEMQSSEDGRFVFKNVNPGPGGTCSIRVISQANYRPATQKIDDLRTPVVIRLQRGLRVTGTVIDDATGRPVPGVEAYAYHVGTGADYEMLDAEGRTNGEGRFVFSNMAQREYRLGVRNANLADSRQSITVTGGQHEPVVLRIRIPEWSDLRPRKPQ
jgi:beta-lactamase regulating signal transducer with metallopeptidase domain